MNCWMAVPAVSGTLSYSHQIPITANPVRVNDSVIKCRQHWWTPLKGTWERLVFRPELNTPQGDRLGLLPVGLRTIAVPRINF